VTKLVNHSEVLLYLKLHAVQEAIASRMEIELVSTCTGPSGTQVEDVAAAWREPVVEPKVSIRIRITCILYCAHNRRRDLRNTDSINDHSRR
jgi:hypothetical protein